MRVIFRGHINIYSKHAYYLCRGILFCSYNADNQMTQYPATTPFERNPGVETQVSYTAQGHTQKESNVLESKEYEYNAAERLIRYASTEQGQSGPQIEASYRHDPFGRRIAKTVKQGSQTKTTYYIYSEQGLMAEADEKGQMTKAYRFNPTTMQLGLWSTDPVWQAETPNGSLTDPKARYDWLHTDHLGTPILATTKEGQTSWKAIAESFGSTQIIEQDIEVNLRFPGQYFDAETGTYYNFHRDYRPNAGRYLQEDPIGLEGGINLFAYVNNNPLLLIDSFGLKGKAKAKADPCPTCDAQLPESPVKEVALTCFAEASYDCDEGDKEKRAITDVIYNRVNANEQMWGYNTVIGVLSKKGQFIGYKSPQYRKAEENSSKLADKECQKLKDCIDAALASSRKVQYEYDGFNQSKGAGRTKICVHYFRIEKAKK